MTNYTRPGIDYRTRSFGDSRRLSDKEKARRAAETERKRLARVAVHEAWIIKDRLDSRNPITDDELLFAEAMGAYLRSLRIESGLPTKTLAERSEIVTDTWRRLECATRHTRHSTLERIANVLGEALGREPRTIYDEMVRLAGPCLAPESLYRDRVESRRATRLQRSAARTARQEAQEVAWRAVRDEIKSFQRDVFGY